MRALLRGRHPEVLFYHRLAFQRLLLSETALEWRHATLSSVLLLLRGVKQIACQLQSKGDAIALSSVMLAETCGEMRQLAQIVGASLRLTEGEEWQERDPLCLTPEGIVQLSRGLRC